MPDVFDFVATLAMITGSVPASPARAAESAVHPWPRDHQLVEVDFGDVDAVASYGSDLWVFGVQGREGAERWHGAARWDGRRWHRPTENIAGTVRAQATWRDQLVVGTEGDRAEADSTGLTAWDGARWRPVSKSFRGTVSALTVWRDDVVVAGRFTIEGRPDLTRLARWDGVAWSDVAGQPAGGGDTRIAALAVHDGELIAGGVFAEIGGVRALDLATCDGERWRPLGRGANGVVEHLASFAGELYAAGKFTRIGGESIANLARWDGQRWRALEGVPTSEPFAHYPAGFIVAPEGLYIAAGFVARLGSPSAPDGSRTSLGLWTGRGWAGLPSMRGRGRAGEPGRQVYWDLPSVRAAAIHQGRLVIESNVPTDAFSGVDDRQGRLLVCDGSRWRKIVPGARRWGAPLGEYNGHLLLNTGPLDDHGTPLAVVDGDTLRPLPGWPDVRALASTVMAAVRGDSLVVASRLSRVVLCFDGHSWRVLGAGADMGDVVHVAISGGKIYAAKRFDGPRPRLHLLRWEDDNWVEVATLDRTVTAFAGIGEDLYVADVRDEFPGIQPRLRRWRDGKWHSAWRAEQGKVVALAHAGDDAWAAVADGAGSPLLRRRGERWEEVSVPQLASDDGGGLNRVTGLALHRGLPYLAGDFHDVAAGRDCNIVFWDGTDWRSIGSPRGEAEIVSAGDRLWIHSRASSSGTTDIFWVDAPEPSLIVHGATATQLAMARESRERFERARHDHPHPLSLPWPRGVVRWQVLSAHFRGHGMRYGWSTDDEAAASAIRQRDDVISLDATVVPRTMPAQIEPAELKFTCIAPAGPGRRLSFEYRSRIPDPLNDGADEGALAITTESGPGFLEPRSFPAAEAWTLGHVQLPAMTRQTWISFKFATRGRVDLRNLAFAEHVPDSVAIERERSALMADASRAAGLLDDVDPERIRDTSADVLQGVIPDSLVKNLDLNLGWTEDDCLYVSIYGLIGSHAPYGGLQALVTDPHCRASPPRGVILDLRHMHRYHRDLDEVAERARVFSTLTSWSGPWLWWIRPSRDSDIPVSASLAPRNGPPFPLPIAAVIDGGTAGEIALLLRRLPEIHVVGRPSAPIIAPTKPAILSDGTIVQVPDGKAIDGPPFRDDTRDVSWQRITPETPLREGASMEEAVRAALETLRVGPVGAH